MISEWQNVQANFSKLKEINSFLMRKYASLIQRLKTDQVMADAEDDDEI